MESNANPLVLVIVDGFGLAPDGIGNAISLAKTPTWDKLRRNHPLVTLKASGNSVGLPDGIMGNSEVGHLTIGTGRITFQSLELINRACKENLLKDNIVIDKIRDHLIGGGRFHLMGLLSDGGVHSHQDHLNELIKIFSDLPNQVYIHAFTDGRDTPPRSASKYVKLLLDEIEEHDHISLASIIGRYYVMDRDKKWDRTMIAYNMLTDMQSYEKSDPMKEIKHRYAIDETDEFFRPIVCDPNGSIRSDDAVLFFNFRPDRARQITQAIHKEWPHVSRDLDNLLYCTMTRYESNWDYPTLFTTEKITNSLSEVISNNKISQSHVAETEKYAHLTYFLNGGEEEAFEGEERILVPSLKVKTYDMQPEMSTMAIADAAVNAIKRRQNLVIVNIAAPDMVGHTGDIVATVKAVETMDRAFDLILKTCREEGYILCITSDHGNAEKMLNGETPHTAHTTNEVPFLTTAAVDLVSGGLENVAPTVLDLMGVDKPEIMTGISLISK